MVHVEEGGFRISVNNIGIPFPQNGSHGSSVGSIWVIAKHDPYPRPGNSTYEHATINNEDVPNYCGLWPFPNPKESRSYSNTNLVKLNGKVLNIYYDYKGILNVIILVGEARIVSMVARPGKKDVLGPGNTWEGSTANSIVVRSPGKTIEGNVIKKPNASLTIFGTIHDIRWDQKDSHRTIWITEGLSSGYSSVGGARARIQSNALQDPIVMRFDATDQNASELTLGQWIRVQGYIDPEQHLRLVTEPKKTVIGN